MDQTDGGNETMDGDETDNMQTGDPGSSNMNLKMKKGSKRTGRKIYSTKPQDFQVFPVIYYSFNL